MSFRDNLIHLRAANNMTQEQLAMLLGVSRQSVTKWEAEKSYPEMDKLLKMCQIFDCTLDDLVQGDLTDKGPNTTAQLTSSHTPADVFGYNEHMNKFAEKISYGAVAPIVGVALGIIFFALAPSGSSNINFNFLPEHIAAALGLVCVFIGIAVCLMLIIPAGMEHATFVREHPYVEDFYTQQQKARARTLFTYELVGGIVAIFFGVCVVVILSESSYEEIIGVPVMLLFIALGVRFIIHGSMTISKVNVSNYNIAAGEVMTAHEINSANVTDAQRQELMFVHRQDKRVGAVCGTIMIIATIAGMVMMFVPQYQTPLFWLAWPIGGMLCGVASLLMKAFIKPVE